MAFDFGEGPAATYNDVQAVVELALRILASPQMQPPPDPLTGVVPPRGGTQQPRETNTYTSINFGSSENPSPSFTIDTRVVKSSPLADLMLVRSTFFTFDAISPKKEHSGYEAGAVKESMSLQVRLGDVGFTATALPTFKKYRRKIRYAVETEHAQLCDTFSQGHADFLMRTLTDFDPEFATPFLAPRPGKRQG